MRALGWCLALAGAPLVAAAQPAVVAPKGAPVVRANAVQWDLTARTGQRYRVYIARPAQSAPPSGYPVLYVLDGDQYFDTAADQIRIRGGGDVVPALVVAVGYGLDDGAAIQRLRTRDFTPSRPTDAELASMRSTGYPNAEYGGAEDFHHFLVQELRPLIAAAYPVDAAEQYLFGHSFGGLFATFALLNHPTDFRTYLIASPSLWWGGRSVLGGEAGFAQRVASGGAAPRVLITVGGDESTVTRVPSPPGLSTDDIQRALDMRRMRLNAIEFADRLQRLRGGAGYEVRLAVFEDENHVSVVAASIARAVSFALGRSRAGPEASR